MLQFFKLLSLNNIDVLKIRFYDCLLVEPYSKAAPITIPIGNHKAILEVKTPTNTPKITPTAILTPFVLFFVSIFY